MPRQFLNLNDRAWTAVRCQQAGFPIPFATRVRYGGMGLWLSALEHIFPPQPEWPAQDIPSSVFIVGHWRSGTTLIHELLCSSQAFAYPTTYACMNPHTFLLSSGKISPPVMQKPRPMDNMIVRTDLPQEDEFALFCLGAPSPYEALLCPQAITELSRRADPAHWSAEELAAWTKAFLRFAAACQAQGGSKLPLLLKSPPHSFRIHLLKRLVPNARFIRIVRRPEDVFQSSRNLWMSLWHLYALAPPGDREARDLAILDTMAALETALDGAQLANDTLMTVRFEDLIVRPKEILTGILRFLGMTQTIPLSMTERIDAMAGYKRGAASLSAKEIARVKESCAHIYAKHRYEV